MKDYAKVGFKDDAEDSGKKENFVGSIPEQVKQFWVEIPAQYRLIYLLIFLYTHQDQKVIVFGSNCETVNLLTQLVQELNWDKCINKRGRHEKSDGTVAFKDDEGKPQVLFDGNIYKLHGDMDHGDRKKNFFGFDKGTSSLLICTDVASRGLDFKGVNWIIQWDLSSQIKEYVNRVGRTARIASAGCNLCFVMPNEKEYITYMKEKHEIRIHQKSRFNLVKLFEQKIIERAKAGEAASVTFRKLKAIDDPDEKQESLHCIRQMITQIMMDETKSLKDKARIAKNSSVRAYAGHSAELKHIFNHMELNLTEYARSFGIYKVVHQTMPKSTFNDRKEEKKSKKPLMGKRPTREEEEKKKKEAAVQSAAGEMFTKRLQKSHIKDLGKNLADAIRQGKDGRKIKDEMDRVRKAVWTDERKTDQRKQGFERAKTNARATALSEFM